MIERLCLLVKGNAYGTKPYYARCFAEALEAAGVRVLVEDLEGKAFEMEHFQRIQAFGAQLTCSFNSILPFSTGQFLWDYTRIPHWLINLDPVVYSLNLFQSPYSVVSCVDRGELRWLQEERGYRRSFFFPHAADGRLLTEDEGERPLGLVLIGSLYDHEVVKERWRLIFNADECTLMEEVVERVLADHCSHFVTVLEEGVRKRAWELSEQKFRAFCFHVDYYLRGRDRWDLLCALAPLDVHIYGALHRDTEKGSGGWPSYLERVEHLQWHGPISYEESLKILQRSKICLNSVPSFKDGTHVRLFTAPLAGALVLSNDSVYLRECFVPGKDVLTYCHGALEELRDSVAEILADEMRRETMVQRARERVLASHTWESRVQSFQKNWSQLEAEGFC